MAHNVVWNCNGLMVKGNNHTIVRNTVFDTSPLNFESDGQQRDIALYSWNDFGSCQCSDDICQAQNDTCCAEGATPPAWGGRNTYENANSVVVGNGMDGFLGAVAGSSAVPSTAAVDAGFSVMLSANNSAGALFEQLRDPYNLDFRPRPGSVWAESSIGAYDALTHGDHYWIPGRVGWLPSMPIPPHNSSGVRRDADLMFLGGYHALRHRVMIGSSPGAPSPRPGPWTVDPGDWTLDPGP